jgi:micrococcal nuclease
LSRAVAVAVGLFGACACSGRGPCGGPSSATVAHVVDGDTLELDTGEKVRYLLVDAPETTNGHHDCYGQEAADFNTSLVDGKQVSLTYDAEQCKDKYGRWLAYVSVGGTDVNKALMEGGYACELYISPGGGARKTEFEDYESVAKTARIGLWGACNPVTCE